MNKNEMNKKYYDNRFIPCWNCQLMGKHGKDSHENDIAFCLLQRIIVDPNIGCNNPKLITRKD
jgi:hypothetical protein